MLQQIHPDAVTQTDRKSGGKHGGTEAEVPENQSQHEKEQQPRSPGAEIGHKGKEPVGPGGSPLPVDKDLEVLVHGGILEVKRHHEEGKNPGERWNSAVTGKSGLIYWGRSSCQTHS
jgi:hypothetical protein